MSSSALLISVVLLAISFCSAQRPFYAGSKPIGYPERPTTTTTANVLGNRFGDDTTGSTTPLPIDALGDKDLIDRLSKLPVDKQPFWFINYQQIQKHRQNPQNYPANGPSFVSGPNTNQRQPYPRTNDVTNTNSNTGLNNINTRNTNKK